LNNKCGEIVPKQGTKHSKAEALRAFMTQNRRRFSPYLFNESAIQDT
jgi:hypothetical protein